MDVDLGGSQYIDPLEERLGELPPTGPVGLFLEPREIAQVLDGLRRSRDVRGFARFDGRPRHWSRPGCCTSFPRRFGRTSVTSSRRRWSACCCWPDGLWIGWSVTAAGGSIGVAVAAGAVVGILTLALDVVGFGILLGRGVDAGRTSGVLGFLVIVFGTLAGAAFGASRPAAAAA